MARRRPAGKLTRVLAAVAAAVALLLLLGAWYGAGPLEKDGAFVVPNGAGLSAIADRLGEKRVISSPTLFKIAAKLTGSKVKAGEFAIPKHASASQVLAIVTSDDVIRRFVTVPEGMPSIMVQERLMAVPQLTGKVPVPPEGAVLPDSYAFDKGETRAEVLKRMEDAMAAFLKAQWPKRDKGLVVATPAQALALASIVEKETGKPSERRLVAGLYANRLRIGMPLQADPTIIYPITRGKPLGRKILESEIKAVNGYNTYTMSGLPEGPITNPGRASILAVLHPASTKALYMVADGTGGHVFADTLEEHNRNVAKWFRIRKERGI